MSLPRWLRKLVRGDAGNRNRRAARRPRLEPLEARLAPAVVLTYGGPGTALRLTETVDPGTHVTVSEPTTNLLQIDLNGATFDATSTASAPGLTYSGATPDASTTATVDIAAAGNVADLAVTLSTANDVLDLGMVNAAGGVARVDVSAASGSNTVNLNAVALGAGGTAGNLTVTTDALNVTADSTIDTTAAGPGSGNVTLTAQLGGITLNFGSGIVTTNGALGLNGTGSADHPDGIDAGGATLDAGTAGSIALVGTGANAPGVVDGVYLFGGTVVQAEGTATVSITGTAPSAGVYVNGTFGTPNTQVSTVDGALSITGTGTGGSLPTGIFIDGGSVVQATGRGSVSLDGTGSGFASDGVFIDGTFGDPTTQVTTAGGDLTVSGTGSGTGEANDGIFIDGGALVHAGGTGTLTLTGTAGGTNRSDGIFIDGTFGSPQTLVTTDGGAVVITGTADITGNRDEGLFIDGGAVIQAGGTGDVTLTGTVGAGTDRNSGIYLDGTFDSGPNTTVAALGGNVFLNGTCQSTDVFDAGISLDDGTLVQAGGGGSVSLQGQAPGDTPALTFDTGFGTGIQVDTGNVSLTGDVIDLGDPGSIASTSSTVHAGQLSFAPFTPGRPIVLGGSDTAGSLVFSADDASAIVQDATAGFSQIVIGRPDGTGQVSVADGGIGFTADLTVETPAAGSDGIVLDNAVGDAGHTVALVSGGAIGGSAAPAVTAACLMLEAQTGVGTAVAPLQTAVTALEATAAGGGIFVQNRGDLTIGCSPVGAGVQVTGPSGDVSISAGGALTLPAGQVVRAPGSVSLIGGAGAVAAVITINGAITGGTVAVNGGNGGDTFNLNPSGGSALTANGGTGSDSFNVTPNPAVAFTIHGNDPAPPANPGDTLNVNLAAAANANLNLTQPTPASGFAGTWTFTNRQPITFDTVETLLPRLPLRVVGQDIQGVEGLSTGPVTVATFTDPAGPGPASAYAGLILWGDGAVSSGPAVSIVPGPGGSFLVQGSHTYADEGNYQVRTFVLHGNASKVAVSSTARITDNVGILLLDISGKPALTLSGAGQVTVGGGAAVLVNSPAAVSATDSGSGQVSAAEMDVGGNPGVQPRGSFPADLTTRATATPDPFAGLVPPSQPAATFGGQSFSGGTTTLLPGTYTGPVAVSGTAVVTLQPGTYYLQGGLTVSGSGQVNGSGVLLFNTPVGSGGGITVTDSGRVTLSAPAGGPGIVLWQAKGSTVPLTVSGQGTLNLTGSLYAPRAAVSVGGTAAALSLQGSAGNSGAHLVAADLQVSGNATVTVGAGSNAPAGSGPATPSVVPASASRGAGAPAASHPSSPSTPAAVPAVAVLAVLAPGASPNAAPAGGTSSAKQPAPAAPVGGSTRPAIGASTGGDLGFAGSAATTGPDSASPLGPALPDVPFAPVVGSNLRGG
jgi:hypothetical protein